MNNSGFLLVNKPAGPTSHDIVNKLRRIIGIKKIGHAGTLDPFADGLLLIAVGREATCEISQFVKLDKEYIATLKLGAVSDTYDCTGKIQLTTNNLQLTKEKINKVLKSFIGKQEQIPPMYSAKKINGKKLYELARKGIEIERQPSQVEIYKIKDIKLVDSRLSFVVSCSSGTYIRSLAHDIGQKLKIGAYLEKLTRTKIGKFKLTDAIELDKINNEDWKNKLLVISD